MRKIGGNPPDGAGLAVDIVQRHVAFGGGVEFHDLRDAEA